MKKLAASLLLCLLPMQTFACSLREAPTLEQNFAQADHVVLAKVLSTRLVVDESKAKDDPERETVEARYEALEQFKGDSDTPVARELVMGPGNCMLGLLTGNLYVFFLSGEQRYAGWPGGSTMLWNLDGTAVKPKLEALRALKAKGG